MGVDNGVLNAYSIGNQLENETYMSNTLMEKCLAKGIRVTSQRQIIVGVIEESEDHPDVDQLYRRAVQEDETISIATVYRTVKLLEEAGVIDRIEFGDGRARYEESGEHHEHLVDVETGDVIEFYHAELEALKEQVAREMGYELVDHRLELFGRKLKS
jgi:Fur family ferric uptake transcriptional regulator